MNRVCFADTDSTCWTSFTSPTHLLRTVRLGFGGRKMKAIVQDGYGSADVLQLRDIDKPVVTEGGVLVRVRAASVNALDWHSVHGGKMIRAISTLMRRPEQPVRGVDVAGHVEAVGAGVTRFAPGDEVFGGAPATFAVQIAKALGAHVTAVTSTRNLELIRSLGPDEIIDYTQEDFTRRGERY